MCLAVPLEVVEVADGGAQGKVLMGGAPLDVGLTLIEDVKVGDHVLVHAGMAIQKLSPEEAQETLEVFQEYFQVMESQEGGGEPGHA